MTIEQVGTIVAMLFSIMAAAVSYGILKAKIDRVEKDLDTARESMVTVVLLNAHIEHLRMDIQELKEEIKHLTDVMGYPVLRKDK